MSMPLTKPIAIPAKAVSRIAIPAERCDQIISPATKTPARLVTWPSDKSNSPLATATVRPEETTISTDI